MEGRMTGRAAHAPDTKMTALMCVSLRSVQSLKKDGQLDKDTTYSALAVAYNMPHERREGVIAALRATMAPWTEVREKISAGRAHELLGAGGKGDRLQVPNQIFLENVPVFLLHARHAETSMLTKSSVCRLATNAYMGNPIVFHGLRVDPERVKFLAEALLTPLLTRCGDMMLSGKEKVLCKRILDCEHVRLYRLPPTP